MALFPKQRFTSPDEFNACIAEASRGGHVGPLKRKPFQIDLSLATLPRTALFMVDPTNNWAARPATGDFLSVTIPVRGGFSAVVGGAGRYHDFGRGEFHLLHEGRDFDYRSHGTNQVLVANILSGGLRQKAEALIGSRTGELAEVISAASPEGGALTRFAHQFWAELQRPGGLWDCPTALAEMEDCLVSLFFLAASATDSGSVAHLAAVRRAEDFLIQHLTRPVARSELARAAGASIRTISRGFRERHGVSPMAWLKARRLEAAQSELTEAVHGEVTVTAVALRYGFENPGRFAAEYRQRFGEYPSQTLRS
jgi:AraC-like DNA-binding protein